MNTKLTVLTSRRAAARARRRSTSARRAVARGAVQGAGRSEPRRDREPAGRCRGGLRLRLHRHAWPRSADRLAPSEGAAGGRPGRGRAQARDVGLLPARARGGRASSRSRSAARRNERSRERVCRARTSSASGTRAGRRWRRRCTSERAARRARRARGRSARCIPRWSRLMAGGWRSRSGDAAKPQGSSRTTSSGRSVVVTMGCGDACPVLPGKRYVDWKLPDPKGRPARGGPSGARRDPTPRRGSLPTSRFTRARPHPLGGE